METCDRCKKPAVIHEIDTKNGVEVHLCKHHAIEAGYLIPETPPVAELITQFAISKKSKPNPQRRAGCSTCETTLGRFRKSGLLGCPDCYDHFERHLEPLVIRAHAGGTAHVGRVPERSIELMDLQLLRKQLVGELDRAVAAEEYERAASLRDRLGGLGASSVD